MRSEWWRFMGPGKWRAIWDDEETGLHVEVRPKRPGWRGPDSIACYVQFSVPRVAWKGSNAWPINAMVLSYVMTRVEEMVREAGLEADLRGAKITRCDLNRNMVLDEPFASYGPLMKRLDVPRAKMRSYVHDTDAGGSRISGSVATGICNSNKTHALVFYDKLIEQEQQGRATQGLPPNLARLELQVKRGKNVRKKLGIATVQDLLDRWEHLPALYEAHVLDTLFRHDLAELAAPRPRQDVRYTSTWAAEIAAVLRWCSKKGVALGRTQAQLEWRVQTHGVDSYARALQPVRAVDRKRVERAVRQMRKAVLRDAIRADPSFGRRYEELRQKVLGGQCWPNRRPTWPSP